MNKTLSFLLCMCFLLNTTIAMSQTYKTESSIPYRQSSPDEYTTHQCVLDIYYPTDSTNFATVVWFHGGGLTGGDKEIPQELQNQGICIVGVRYRLCTDDRSAINADVKTSDCIDDAAAAAAWVMKNIEKYGGDRNRIFLAGHSAGGYLVSMIGFDKSRLAKYGVDADDFAALIPYSGQMITHFHNRKQRGITIMEQLLRLRLEQAKILLRRRKYKIKDVAKLSGFSNFKYFNTVFRRYEGVSPGRYTKTLFNEAKQTYGDFLEENKGLH